MSLLSLLLSFSPQQSNLNSSLSSHLSLAHGGGYFLAWAPTWVRWRCGLWLWWPKLVRGFSGMDVGYAWQGGSWQARSQRVVSRLHGVDSDKVGHRLMIEVSGFWFWVGFDGVWGGFWLWWCLDFDFLLWIFVFWIWMVGFFAMDFCFLDFGFQWGLGLARIGWFGLVWHGGGVVVDIKWFLVVGSVNVTQWRWVVIGKLDGGGGGGLLRESKRNRD